jgi:hypothetical protein
MNARLRRVLVLGSHCNFMTFDRNTKVVQNQEDFARGILRQAGYELDQQPEIHGIPVHHETHLSLVGDGRYHTDMPLFGHHPDDRSLSSVISNDF